MASSPTSASPASIQTRVPWEPETYRRLFQEAPIGLFRVLEDGCIAEANPALLHLVGCALQHGPFDFKWRDLYPSQEAWQVREAKLRNEGVLRGMEFEMRRLDGSMSWVRESCSLRRLPDGTALFEGCLEDISSQVETRQQLERTHQELNAILRSISSILIEVGPDERIRLWNSEAEKAFGIEAKDALGRKLPEFGLPGLQAICRDSSHGQGVWGEENGSGNQSEVRFKRPDGTDGLFGFSVNILQECRGCLIVGRDITAKREIESQLQQASKMEAIGQLAAGIAHEINTPTQYVGDNLHFLQGAFRDLLQAVGRLEGFIERHPFPGAASPKSVQELNEALQEADLGYLKAEIPEAILQSLGGIERISRIVLAMRDFSHPGTCEKTAVDLNRVIESSLTVSRALWKQVAEVKTDLEPDLPPVAGLANELNQVMLNLIVNAAQALEETAGDGLAKGLISITSRRRQNNAEVCVRDNGPGIPEKVQNRIFDPFFTTKEVGKGTGQGLAIAHKVIVKDHGGRLHFETKSGEGAAFIVSLPLAVTASQEGQLE